MEKLEIFSVRLRRARKRIGLTQRAVAEAVGVTKQAVTQWESGVHEPRLREFNELVSALSIDPDYLLGRTDNPHLAAKGGGEMEDHLQPLREEIAALRLLTRQTADQIAVLERIVRNQLPIAPADWKRLTDHARRQLQSGSEDIR